MKRLFLVIISLLSFFSFSSNVLAYDTCTANNPVVPCDYYYEGSFFATFSDYFFTGDCANSPGGVVLFYNPDTNNSPYGRLWEGHPSLYASAESFVTLKYVDGNSVLWFGPGGHGYNNLIAAWGYCFEPDDYKATQDIYDYYGSTFLYPANASSSSPPENYTLTVNIEPLVGGTVEVNEMPCTTCPCIYTLSEMDQSSIHATANTGYAFGYWKEATNPYPITPSGNKTMTAMFFKTFRNAVGDFYADINDNGGWCVDYVDYETGITNASGQPFSGDAWTYYQQAVDAGYQTGSVPRVGAIIVFSRDASLTYGHVGIVVAINGNTIMIRDSNWCDPYCFLIKEHTVLDISAYTVNYIYYTPQ